MEPTPWLPQLRANVANVWRVRGLMYELTLRDVRVRYKQAVLGVLWALFTPILVVLAGIMVRLTVAYSSGHATDHGALAAIAVKAVPWSFFAGAVSAATGSLTSNAALLTKVYFPREVLPLSTVFAQVVDLSAGAIAAGVLAAAFGAPLSWALLWVPLLVLLLVGFTMAVTLLLSCLNVFFRDVKYIVQVLITFGIFFTPVFFEASMLGARGARLVMLNPLAPLLEGLRLAVVRGHDLTVPLRTAAGLVEWDPRYLAYSAAWTVLGLPLAALIFSRLESRFADYV